MCHHHLIIFFYSSLLLLFGILGFSVILFNLFSFLCVFRFVFYFQFNFKVYIQIYVYWLICCVEFYFRIVFINVFVINSWFLHSNFVDSFLFFLFFSLSRFQRIFKWLIYIYILYTVQTSNLKLYSLRNSMEIFEN